MKYRIAFVVGVVVVASSPIVFYSSSPGAKQRSNTQQVDKNVNQSPAPIALVPENNRMLSNLPQMYHGIVRFEIRNEGNAELRLNHSKQSSCSCATTSLEKESLAPGEKTNYVIDFDTKDKMGPFTIASSIATNDPRSPRLNFSIQMVICPDVMLKPSSLQFGILAEGKRSERTVFVYSTVHDDLKVNLATVSDVACKVDLKPLTADELKSLDAKSGVKATFIVDGHLPIGPFTERVMFQTNNERSPTCSVDVVGVVEGKLQAVPKEIDFGSFSDTEGHEKTVQIVGRGLLAEDDLKLGEVTPAFLNAELKKEPNHQAWKLKIRLPAEAPTGLHVGSIAIMDQNGVKRMIVPIRAMVNATVKSPGQ